MHPALLLCMHLQELLCSQASICVIQCVRQVLTLSFGQLLSNGCGAIVEAMSLVVVVLQVLADIEDDSIGLVPLLSLGMCRSYCFI